MSAAIRFRRRPAALVGAVATVAALLGGLAGCGTTAPTRSTTTLRALGTGEGTLDDVRGGDGGIAA